MKTKVVSGFVVKREYWEKDQTSGVAVKRRTQVSRVYHSRDAAETLMALLKKEHPDDDYYVSEKEKPDKASLF